MACLELEAYLELEVYSEYCQTSTMERFSKTATKRIFFIFRKTETGKNFAIFNEAKLSYISRGTSKAPKTKISNISRKNVMNKFF